MDQINSTHAIQEGKDNHGVIWRFAQRVQHYVPGSLGWIAQQMDRESRNWTDDFCFRIGERVGCVDVNDARDGDETVVLRVATEMLGYPPGSAEDLIERKRDAEDVILKIDAEIASRQNDRNYYTRIVAEMDEKLAALKS